MSSGVFTTWQLGPRMSKRLEKLSRCIEPRTSRLIPLPEQPQTKARCRRRACAEERSLQAQESGGCHNQREWHRRCATRGDRQRTSSQNQEACARHHLSPKASTVSLLTLQSMFRRVCTSNCPIPRSVRLNARSSCGKV